MINYDEVIKDLKDIASEIKQNINNCKKPLVVEFLGLPKSGKTTIINSLALFLRRNQIPTKIISERASSCPIGDKKHLFFNVWTGCSSLVQLLEESNANRYKVIIFDRGIYDSIIWLNVLSHEDKVSNEELFSITSFFKQNRFINLIDLVINVNCDVEKALEREYSSLLTDIQGTIMNDVWLNKYKETISTLDHSLFSNCKKVINIDTTVGKPIENIEKATREILDSLKFISAEELVCISINDFVSTINISTFSSNIKDLQLLKLLVEGKRKTDKRINMENNSHYLQIVPISILECDDKIAVFTKYEKNTNQRFHGKNMIWVGGHLRDEDVVGDSVDAYFQNCLEREIREELRINNIGKIEFIGIVYDKTDAKSLQHLGVCWKVILSKKIKNELESKKIIHESTGQSVGISFVDNTISSYEDIKLEKWSQIILKNIYKINIESEQTQMYMF